MDLIDRQAAIVDAKSWIAVNSFEQNLQNKVIEWLKELPPAQPAELETLIKALEQEHKKLLEMQKALPEIIRCKDCKFNPKYEWFGCPMSHLSEKQRPETAWCWKAERR